MARMKIQVNVPEPAGAGATRVPQYDVRIGTGVLEKLGAHLAAVPGMAPAARPQLLLVTDDQVGPLYAAAAKASLAAAGYKVRTVTVPSGEGTKVLDVAAELWEAMAQLGFGRDSAVVALGGGVVGDLAGFVAANYLRGVPAVQVPTTLLAMADASVGGKVAIDLAAGKNLVGAFLQPAYVCADIACLDTLPARERACGLAEAAKAALTDSDDFYFWLAEAAPELARWVAAGGTGEDSDADSSADEGADAAGSGMDRRAADLLTELVARCVVFKADIVGQDPYEQLGIRERLNYGHTLGHALERCLGYGVVSHGAAVAEGMRFAAELGKLLGTTPDDVAAAQNELLDALGLAACGHANAGGGGLFAKITADGLLDAMHHDKKARGGGLRFVLLRDIGVTETVAVDDAVVLQALAAWLDA